MQRIVKLAPLRPRPADGHKGTFGRVLVIGGSATMIGAPAYCALAAYHTGAGYVQVGTPKETLLATLALTPQAIGLELPSDAQTEAIEKANAIAIGPGLGQLPAAGEILRSVLAVEKPTVLDADALNLLAAGKVAAGELKGPCVLTPHPGEMKRLGELIGKPKQNNDDEADRIDTALRAATALKQIVVLKGHHTLVTDGQRLYENRTGSTALAKAGSGDILSGITGALLAQKNADAFEAACAAVWIHGKAGEIAGQRAGERSAMAVNIIDAISQALFEYGHAFGNA